MCVFSGSGSLAMPCKEPLSMSCDCLPLHAMFLFQWFLVHLSRRLKCTIVITHCPSSVCPSVRPSLTFHIFDFFSENRWTEIQRNLTGSKISTSSTKFVFFGPIGRTWWPPWPLIGWDIFRLLLWYRRTEFNETWQEVRSQCPLPSLCFLGRSEKTRWPPWPLIGWDIFDFSSETAERNSTKLDRKQDHNVLYQVCVFQTDRKNKMAALASDWLRHFRLFLWNRWTEFNETWQEARSQRPLPSLCFSGRSEKQDGRPGLWLAETFLTSSLKPLNRIQWNLTGSKISTSSS